MSPTYTFNLDYLRLSKTYLGDGLLIVSWEGPEFIAYTITFLPVPLITYTADSEAPIDPNRLPVNPSLPNRVESGRTYGYPFPPSPTPTSHVCLQTFFSRYRGFLYKGLVLKYLQEGHDAATAEMLALSKVFSTEGTSLFHSIASYESTSTPSIPEVDVVDLSYSFHTSNIEAFSDYTVGVYPWEGFLSEGVVAPPQGAFSPFLIDPVIFNTYTHISSDRVVMGSLLTPYLFLIDLDNLSIIDAVRASNVSLAHAWSVSDSRIVVVGTQSELTSGSFKANTEAKYLGTRITVLEYSEDSFGNGVTYIFPVASVVGFDLIDNIPYAATSFCKGEIQYTNIIDTVSRSILFREELHLPTFLGTSLDDIRTSLFTSVMFFKHGEYVVAAIIHSHTLCTGQTKNMVTFCTHDSSIESTSTESATYYSCRIRTFNLPDGYYSVLPMEAHYLAEDNVTVFLLAGYDAGDLNA